MKISVIVAVSDNGVIGIEGKIPWKLSTDLVRFEEITTAGRKGHPIIMGRKTRESIGKKLKGRLNVVVSETRFKTVEYREFRDEFIWLDDDVICTPSLSEALYHSNKSEYEQSDIDDHEIFIIGGQQIYDEIFKTPELIHRVYLTRVHCNVEGDAFFKYHYNFPCTMNIPNQWRDVHRHAISKDWKEIREEFIPKSDKDEYDSTFQVWENRG
jgi:dihydrofolate reductase